MTKPYLPAATALLAFIVLFCPLPACLGQRPAQNPMSPNPIQMGYELVWEDQFNGTTLDTNKWEVRGVGPRALGFVSPEAVKVEEGYLKLGAV